MEKKINLEKILDFHIGLSSGIHPAKHFYINAMIDACRQVLELAAENADVRISQEKGIGDRYYADDIGFFVYADKQSILNTINQVE